MKEGIKCLHMQSLDVTVQQERHFRDLATDLIINERIETTVSKAKELRPIIEKMVTLGKRGDLHARRQVAAYIRKEVANEETGQDAVQKLFDEIAPRFEDRQGGYTRVLKQVPVAETLLN